MSVGESPESVVALDDATRPEPTSTDDNFTAHQLPPVPVAVVVLLAGLASAAMMAYPFARGLLIAPASFSELLSGLLMIAIVPSGSGLLITLLCEASAGAVTAQG